MTQNKTFIMRLRRAFAKWLFRQILRVLFRLKFSGYENVPEDGPYLIAHNHVSIIEPALVLSFWPGQPEAMAAAELWHRRGQSWIVKLYNATPVQRGEYGRAVLQMFIDRLNQGAALMIAPEGTRSHTAGMGRAQPGIAYIVEKTGVPIVPVGVVGSTDENLAAAFKFKRPLLEMRIGEPFTLPPLTEKGKARREARQRNADEVLLKVAELLPEAYKGVYASDEYITAEATF